MLHNRHFLECFALVPDQGPPHKSCGQFSKVEKTKHSKATAISFSLIESLFFRTLFGKKT